MFIDIYTHILPPAVASALDQMGSGLGIAKRMKTVRDVYDLDSRFRSMDEIGDYRQIVSLPNPPLEAFTTPAQAIELAKVANDGMAELVRKHPDRFPGFVAALPMHEVEPSVAEARRAIGELGAKGIQLFTNVNGKPIDATEYAPLFALAAEYDLPIWLHPTTPPRNSLAMRCGGASAGPTRPRSQWRGWSSLASSIAIPRSRSSPIMAAG
jgi:predicted TIM-barrel fold metal-dependent hydrolase